MVFVCGGSGTVADGVWVPVGIPVGLPSDAKPGVGHRL